MTVESTNSPLRVAMCLEPQRLTVHSQKHKWAQKKQKTPMGGNSIEQPEATPTKWHLTLDCLDTTGGTTENNTQDGKEAVSNVKSAYSQVNCTERHRSYAIYYLIVAGNAIQKRFHVSRTSSASEYL